ncbi:hypothetical protein CBLAS_1546 [Campylobacter blaseri]|uniref:Uncharacterized protein n=1 Tax=Campylobacter blaseri TaxID=2042961 RepID=A0A2P8QZE2_9BACT|nr:hypothetical protein [Campylobacter blaseri]PSM51617.1 hypothetical protein CQ405_07425 [Campylobacter blaseri]PSM53410.1 hypothetical protein CRN67_07430 [Campylobacter blaseri]QKF86707.1 hypothetical protein CBLAS_1546 [Campylobacter blaseri]
MRIKALEDRKMEVIAGLSFNSVVEKGDEYDVYGILLLQDELYFLVCSNDDFRSYCWALASLFEILDPELPNNWIFAKTFLNDKNGYICSYDELSKNTYEHFFNIGWNEFPKDINILLNAIQVMYKHTDKIKEEGIYGNHLRKLMSWSKENKEANFKLDIAECVSIEISNFTGKTNLDIVDDKDENWFSIEANKDKFSAYSSLDNLEIVLKYANEWVGV